MKLFFNTPEGETNLNLVDEHNRFIGFNYQPSCNEEYGFTIKHANTDEIVFTAEWNVDRDSALLERVNGLLTAYRFLDAPPKIESQERGAESIESATFTAVSDGERPLNITIFNTHNGHYSHGFTYDLGVSTGGGDL